MVLGLCLVWVGAERWVGSIHSHHPELQGPGAAFQGITAPLFSHTRLQIN